MALTFTVQELRSGTGSMTGADDSISTEWNVDYQVTVSDPANPAFAAKDVTFDQVITSDALPTINKTIYTYDNQIVPYLLCRKKTAKRDDRRIDRWLATASFTGVRNTNSQGAFTLQPPPTNIVDLTPTEVASVESMERVLYTDKSGDAEAFTDPNGKAIRTPSNLFYSEPVIEQIPILTIKLTQHEPYLSYADLIKRMWRTNSTEYRGQPRYRWLITNIEPTETELRLASGLVTTALVTYTLKFIPLSGGWRDVRALIDQFYVDDEGNKKPFTNTGTQTRTWGFVNEDGTRKLVDDGGGGMVPATYPDYVQYEQYWDIDFSTFLRA